MLQAVGPLAVTMSACSYDLLRSVFLVHRNADETHAVAKRQLEKMLKLRTVFGLPKDQDSKEGQAFDRELQEQRKRDKEMEKELREKTRVKQAKALKKEVKRKEKERQRVAKQAEKDLKKQEKQRQQVCCTALLHVRSCKRCLMLFELQQSYPRSMGYVKKFKLKCYIKQFKLKQSIQLSSTSHTLWHNMPPDWAKACRITNFT